MLSPYRVLDLTDERGLLCAQILGDLGADVESGHCQGGTTVKKANRKSAGASPSVKTPAIPKTGGINHVILNVNDLARSKPFYAALMPRIGYPTALEFGNFLGWYGNGCSFWLKQADPRYAGETFSKDRVGLCEVAFNAESRAQIDSLARDLESFGGRILDPPREYPEYADLPSPGSRPHMRGYYAVFFADPEGIKLELCHNTWA